METSGPGLLREAAAPLWRLAAGKDHPRPSREIKPFLRYAIPIMFLALAGAGLAAGAYLHDDRGLDGWTAALLGAGSVLPVMLMVRRPLVAWRLAYLMLLAGSLHYQPKEPWPWNPVQVLGTLAVLFVLAAAESSPVTVWAVALTLIPVFGTVPRNAFGAAVAVIAVSVAGDLVARRRQNRRRLEAQAEVGERERARRAVLEERTRIAREMHDVVAHHMSMIAVQAETAPYRVADLPDSAKAELATIAVAARAALTDMRRLLGVLRSAGDEAPRGPQPGLGDVPELVETARRAGVSVVLHWVGAEPGGGAVVREAVGLAAYRIVQDALANAARHAPGGPVTIDGRVRDDRLELRIHNDPGTGAAAGPAGLGLGLVGMRERAELLGGTLTAGADGGGFLVTAALPLPLPSSSEEAR
jgi:signal transduction histidine kinase